MDWIKLLHVKPEELYSLLGVKGLEDVSTEHMILLAGYKTALQDGETTVDAIFRAEKAATPPAGRKTAD